MTEKKWHEPKHKKSKHRIYVYSGEPDAKSVCLGSFADTKAGYNKALKTAKQAENMYPNAHVRFEPKKFHYQKDYL